MQAVRECVLRRHYEQAVTALGAEIEQRATQSQADSLDDRLQVLQCTGLIELHAILCE